MIVLVASFRIMSVEQTAGVLYCILVISNSKHNNIIIMYKESIMLQHQTRDHFLRLDCGAAVLL